MGEEAAGKSSESSSSSKAGGSGAVSKHKTFWGKTINVFFVVGGLVLLGIQVLQNYEDNPEGSANVQGYALQSNGKLDEAIIQFNEAIRLSPKWYHPYLGRGIVYRLKGDYEKAIADFNLSIEYNSDYPGTYFERGIAYRAEGNQALALSDLAKAIELKPEMAEAYHMRALIERDRGDFSAASADLDSAIARRGDKADWYIDRARISILELNRPKQAADDFAVALRSALNYRDIIGLLDSESKTSPAMMDYQHPFDPDGYYLLLWTHFARLRAEQDDSKELAEQVKELALPIWKKLHMQKMGQNVDDEAQAKSLAPWPGAIVRMFFGKLSPDAIRALAEEEADAVKRRRRVCDANFYVAEYHLQKGTNEPARLLLRAAANDCPAGLPEAELAAAEIRRLGL